jgi:hypothetical protein
LQDKLHTLVRQRFEDGKLDQAWVFLDNSYLKVI